MAPYTNYSGLGIRYISHHRNRSLLTFILRRNQSAVSVLFWLLPNSIARLLTPKNTLLRTMLPRSTNLKECMLEATKEIPRDDESLFISVRSSSLYLFATSRK